MDLKALPLIVVEKGNTYRVSDEALEFLQSVRKPIAVVSIAGAYRSGKSFLMNRLLLNRFSGFETASTIHACTKGLWIWNQPIDIVTSEGIECAMLVVDSEGLGDTKEDANHDTRIYMLAMLLSSMFIYNGKTAIDEQSLSTMSLMLELCKNLRLGSDESSGEDLSNYFPSLLWVIRDFALRLEQEDGTEMSMSRYLSNSLEDQKGTSNAVETKNRARRLIKHFFKERECFGLVRPTDDERALQALSSDTQLRPEFLEQIRELYGLIMKKIRPKSMRGRMLTGELLGSLTISYAAAINQGGVPNIQSAWTNVCKSENQRIVSETESSYESQMAAQIGEDLLTEEILTHKHKKIREELLGSMRERTVGSWNEIEPFLNQVKARIKARFIDFQLRNEKRALTKCEALLKMFTDDAFTKLKRGEYAQIADFRKEMDQYINEMRKKTPINAHSELKLHESIEKLTIDAIEYLHRSQDTEKSNEMRRLNEQNGLLQGQLAQRKDEFVRERDTLSARMQEMEKECHGAKAQVIALGARVEDLLRDRERVDEHHREQLTQLREDSKERLDDTKQRYLDSQASLTELTKASSREISDLRRDLMLAKQESDYRTKECEELKRKRMELEEDARVNRTEINKLKQVIEGLEIEVKRTKSEAVARTVRNEGAEAPMDWAVERTQLKGQIEVLKGQLTERQSVQDVLMSALQSRSSEGPRNAEKALETATNLSAALERNEQRCLLLEKKLERLKRYQKMIKNSSSLTCRLCSKTLNSAVFGAHITVCMRDANRAATSVPTLPINITITQATVKEGTDQRSFTEYLITVSYKGKSWTVNRRYKLFSQLNENLEQAFPNVEMPEEATMFRHQSINLIMSNSKPKSIDERRKMLQSYLNQLAGIPMIRDNPIFTQFIGVNLYFPEEYGSPSPIRASEDEMPPSSYRYPSHGYSDPYSSRGYSYDVPSSPSHPEDSDLG